MGVIWLAYRGEIHVGGVLWTAHLQVIVVLLGDGGRDRGLYSLTAGHCQT